MGSLFLLILVAVYFVPTIVAYSRRKDDIMAILLLNLFLGWTLVGWVVALVWAVTKDKEVVYVPKA